MPLPPCSACIKVSLPIGWCLTFRADRDCLSPQGMFKKDFRPIGSDSLNPAYYAGQWGRQAFEVCSHLPLCCNAVCMPALYNTSTSQASPMLPLRDDGNVVGMKASEALYSDTMMLAGRALVSCSLVASAGAKEATWALPTGRMHYTARASSHYH